MGEPRHSVYSFSDYNISIISPLGMYSIVGEGIGSVAIEYMTTNSKQELSADGSIMTSKIKGRNGKITFTAQQTSAVNKYLVKLYNTLYAAPSALWKTIEILITNQAQQEVCTITGGCFEKMPDKQMQAEGQNRGWPILADTVIETEM